MVFLPVGRHVDDSVIGYGVGQDGRHEKQRDQKEQDNSFHRDSPFPSTFYHGMGGGAMGRSDTVDVRESLKLYLDAHDVVQAQLAKEAGMTRQKLNAVLHKQRKLDANEFMKICDVLEISADDLWCHT